MKTEILGLQFDNLTREEAALRGAQLLAEDRFPYVVTPNPEFILAAEKDDAFRAILNEADLVLPDGVVVPNERLTTDPTPPASYAYCSDTAMDMRVAEAVKGVEVLYHESTYGDDGLHKAAPRGHSTARQAGEIARVAEARTLVLGHYSKTIFDEARLAAEAAEVFDGKVIAGNEGIKIDLA